MLNDAFSLVRRNPALRRVAVRLGRVVRPYWVLTFELRVSEHGQPHPVPRSEVSTRRGTADDAAALLPPLLRGGEPPARRFARGDTLLVAELEGRLVGCRWISDGPMTVEYYRLQVAPRPRARYCYGFYVRREVRRRGVGRALERATLLDAEQTGTQIYWCHVDGFSRISRAAHCAVGWRQVEESRGLVLLNRFGVRLWRRTWPSSPPASPA